MMSPKKCMALAAAAGMAAVGFLATVADAAPKGAKNCVVKAAEGTGATESVAKFQVDEALLQAVDWGAWSAWIATGSTPGYDFGKRSYKCKSGGVGVSCVGQAKICKL